MYRFTSTLLSPFVRYPRQLQLPVSLLTVFLWRSSVSRAALSETLRRPLFSSSPLSSPLSFPSPSIPSGIFEQVERKSYPSMSALETKEKEKEMENSYTTICNSNDSNNVSKETKVPRIQQETVHGEKEEETTTNHSDSQPSDTIDTDSPTDTSPDKDVIDTHYISGISFVQPTPSLLRRIIIQSI